MDLTVLGALIGLAGAVGNNGKTEDTDALVRQAILFGRGPETVEAIHREKYRISPNCETCACPCGNTSDYDVSRFARDGEEEAAEKKKVLEQLPLLTEKSEEGPLPELIYKAIAYLGYELTAESYRELLKEMEL